MALSRWERKEKLGFGSQAEIATRLKVQRSVVSAVVNDKAQSLSAETVRKVQVAVARKIGLPVDDVFDSVAA
jgi:predicted XRE-type DNA-binding protein